MEKPEFESRIFFLCAHHTRVSQEKWLLDPGNSLKWVKQMCVNAHIPVWQVGTAVNCGAYDLSKRAGVPLGKCRLCIARSPVFKINWNSVFFYFPFKISILLIFKCWPQYIKTPRRPNKTHLVARWFPWVTGFWLLISIIIPPNM